MTETIANEIGYFHEFLEQSTARVNVIYGGGGSGKSRAIAQYLFKKFIAEQDKRFLILRKTRPSLRDSVYHLMLHDVMPEYGFSTYGQGITLDKTTLTLTYGKNEMEFRGLDDPEKKKSADYNYVWMEEATDFNRDDFQKMMLYLRRKHGKNEINQMFLSFNPIDQFHWVITDILHGSRDDVAINHSTYKNNRFLPAESAQEYENLVNQDENLYRIYTLGEPGILKNTIFTNYQVFREAPPIFEDVIYGLDFGYNNPTALIGVGFKENNIYPMELIYESHLTNAELIQRMKHFKIGKAPIYADASEPARIDEIARAGYNILPADKSVTDGIDAVKRCKIFLNPDNVNILAEIKGYKYREDKNGHVLEEPVKFRDHSLDALRYAVHSHMKKIPASPGKYAIIGKVRRW
jgi:phage terminase large subunit